MLLLNIVLEVSSMAKIPNIVPITDLRQDATSIMKRVTSSREPLVITQRGRAAAVMVSMEAYEHTQHELEILRLLARGEKEIEAGKGYDLDAVLAEADSLLEGMKA
jgi:prevent-host-death family protein